MKVARHLIAQLITVALLACSVLAQQPGDAKPASNAQAEAAKPAAPAGRSSELQKYADMVLGTWTVQESHEGSEMMPAGISTGTAMFRNGPGGYSVVENMSLNGSMGKFTGMGVVWYDAKDQLYKGLWCDSQSPACDTSFSAKWEGDKLIATGSSEMPGGKMYMREEYTDISPNGFTFTMYGGPDQNSLKKFMTMRYTRKSGPRPASKTEGKR